MNMKRWTKIMMGAVCGVMLTAVSTTGWTRTAFICEGRIGNAATNPGTALGGDFEFDISTNTAAPAVTMQFAWTNGVPVEASIRFDPSSHMVTFTINGEHSRTMAVDPTIFDDPNGLGFLNFRNRAVKLNSSVQVTDMKINIDGDVDAAGQPNWIDLDPLGPTFGNGESLRTEHNWPLQRGFTLNYKITFWWDTSNPPARSHLAVQIGANEYPEVASVTLKEVDPDTLEAVDPVAADSPTGNLKMGNPESHGGGLMFFAEKNTPTGSVHNKLKVMAKLNEKVPLGTTVTVYFKIFDMDDPTQDYITTGTPRVNIVDDTDLNDETFAGRDNYRERRGSGGWRAPLPELSAASVILNTNEDTASVTFEIPEVDRRPGNNWKVVAHTDLGYLDDVEIDDSATSKGLGFRLKSNPTILVPMEVQTELVSIWRKIHVEFDTMKPPPADEPFGLVKGKVFGPSLSTDEIFAYPNPPVWRPLSLNGGVLGICPLNLLLPPPCDDDDLDPGITLNPNLPVVEVFANSDVFGGLDGDRIAIIYLTHYSENGHDDDGDGQADDADEIVWRTLFAHNGDNYAIHTDDPKWRDAGPSGLEPPPLGYTLDHFNATYKPAYIVCVPLLSHFSEVDFIRNTATQVGQVGEPGDENFWTACIAWGYEYLNTKLPKPPPPGCAPKISYEGDDDPENEGVPMGYCMAVSGESEESEGHEGIYSDRSVVWCETARDASNLNGHAVNEYIAFVAAHEMGHQFGLIHAWNLPNQMTVEQFLEKPEGTPLYDLPIYDPDTDGIMSYFMAKPPPDWNICKEKWLPTGNTYKIKYTMSLQEIRHMRMRGQDWSQNQE